ncbi:MAG: nicotinate (nicotinamide) nucleotide adenylyltransferase [Deltaproteobacteria bacterium]|jgi:nicotinate-nucleotide adenylyltransferase|nr:nicotinate (nicotinamide) nucleotide adenylyltransferase [Deltaproteobacteria bacterium]
MRDGVSSGIAILGGSFNPPHLGHLRLALEVFEALRPERLDFVPCAAPPHKAGAALLPFALRCSMLREALAPFPFFKVNPVEASLPAPSYTCLTLRAYRREAGAGPLYFILGAGDFTLLDSWKDWRELSLLATLVVVSRQGEEAEEVAAAMRRFWPGSEPRRALPGERGRRFSLPEGGEVCYMPVTRLDINASLVRERWLKGLRTDFLVPDAVRDRLSREGPLVKRCWGGTRADAGE